MLYTPTTDNYNKLRHVSLQLNLKAACPHPHTRVHLQQVCRYLSASSASHLPVSDSTVASAKFSRQGLVDGLPKGKNLWVIQKKAQREGTQEFSHVLIVSYLTEGCVYILRLNV